MCLMNLTRTASRIPLGPPLEGAQTGTYMMSLRLILAGDGPTLLWTILEVCRTPIVQGNSLLMALNCGYLVPEKFYYITPKSQKDTPGKIKTAINSFLSSLNSSPLLVSYSNELFFNLIFSHLRYTLLPRIRRATS